MEVDNKKNGTINYSLDAFVMNEKMHSYYHYLVANTISHSFENDKTHLALEGNYWLSDNDKKHARLGSVAGYRVTFSKNEEVLCEGYLTFSTYGRRFVEENDEEKVQEFDTLLTDTIMVPFRQMIEGELGFLYERHRRRLENQINRKS